MRLRAAVGLGAGAAALVAAAAVFGIVAATEPDRAPASSAESVRAGRTAATAPAGALAADGLQDPARNAEMSERTDAPPTRLRIPSIGVDAAVESLGIGASGELVAPVDYDLAGWFAGGVFPGEVGPAILAGHVDSPTGPAVFLRIGELAVGDEVLVESSNGETLTFEITGSRQSSKAEFPTSDVYSNVPRPELRLITCAGTFDHAIGHYTDNLILFAALKA